MMLGSHRVFVLVLCASATALLAQEPMAAQEKPLAGQTLRWGADADGGIPYVIADPDGKKRDGEPDGPVTGFEADLRDALERELGCRIVFRQLNFDNLYTELDQNNCDLAMNGLEIIAENRNRAAFTRPYYIYQQQLVTRVSEKRFDTLQQCRDQGLVVGTLGGCAAVRVLKSAGFAAHAIKEYKEQSGLYMDLRDRQVDAVLLDLPAAIYYATPYKQLKFVQTIGGLKLAGLPFAEGYYGIAVKKDNKQLLAQLDAALDRIRQSGELKRILVKWDLWNLDQYRLYEAIDTGEGESGDLWPFHIYFPLLLDAAAVTVFITICGFALAVLLGLPLSLMRLYGSPPLKALAMLYVEFFRGIPVLLLLYFLYYGFGHFSDAWNMPWLKPMPLVAAIFGFALNYAAYEAEIYRAGLGSIAIGQWEAAASLGMSAPLTFRRVILPQAIRVILPPMTNDFVALFKDTSVVGVIAVVELSTRYQILTKSGGGYVQIGLCTAALYLVMSVPLGHLSRYLEKRWGRTGGG